MTQTQTPLKDRYGTRVRATDAQCLVPAGTEGTIVEPDYFPDREHVCVLFNDNRSYREPVPYFTLASYEPEKLEEIEPAVTAPVVPVAGNKIRLTRDMSLLDLRVGDTGTFVLEEGGLWSITMDEYRSWQPAPGGVVYVNPTDIELVSSEETETPTGPKQIVCGDVVRVTNILGLAPSAGREFHDRVGELVKVTDVYRYGDNVDSHRFTVVNGDGRVFSAIVEAVDAETAATFVDRTQGIKNDDQFIYVGTLPGFVGEVVTVTDSRLQGFGINGKHVYVTGRDGDEKLLALANLVPATVEKQIEIAVAKATAEATRAEQRRVIQVAMSEGEHRGWCSELEEVLVQKLKYDLDSFAQKASGEITVTIKVEDFPINIRTGMIEMSAVREWLREKLAETVDGLARTRDIGSENSPRGRAYLGVVTDASGLVIDTTGEAPIDIDRVDDNDEEEEDDY